MIFREKKAERLVSYSNRLQNTLAIILGAALQKPYYLQKPGFATKAIDLTEKILSTAPFSPLFVAPIAFAAKNIAKGYEEKTLLSLLEFARSIGVNNLTIFTKELNRRYVEARIDPITAENSELPLEDDFKALINAIIKININPTADTNFKLAALSILPSPLVRESKLQIFDDLIERILKEAIKDYSQENSSVKKLLNGKRETLLNAQKDLQKAVTGSSFKNTLSDEERDKFVQDSPVRLRARIFNEATTLHFAKNQILQLTANINLSLAESMKESGDENIIDPNQNVLRDILNNIEEIEGIALKNGYGDICQKNKRIEGSS